MFLEKNNEKKKSMRLICFPKQFESTNENVFKILQAKVYGTFRIDTNQDRLDEKASPGQGTFHSSRQIPTVLYFINNTIRT